MDKKVLKQTTDFEANLPLLKRKISRNFKKTINEDKNCFNLEEYKEKVIEQLSNIKTIPKKSLEKNKSNVNTCIEYENLYRKYIQEQMNNNILIYLNHILMDLPQSITHLKNKIQLHKILFEIFKSTMMNELEVVYFKILLDKFGWETEGISFEENMLLICFEVKMLLNDDVNILYQHHVQYNKNITDLINLWRNSKKDFYKLSISPKELNMTFKNLSKPSNPYCKADFVDFNFIVDHILELSSCENKNNTNNQEELKSAEKLTQKKKVNLVKNNIIINENNVNEISPIPLQFNPKLTVIAPGENNCEKISNTIDSVNNNNFANMINQNYQYESGLLIGDNKIFNKNESENMNLFSRLCSFSNSNNFNLQSQREKSFFQINSQTEDNEDKLGASFFKNIHNTGFKIHNSQEISSPKIPEESPSCMNVKIQNPPVTNFVKYSNLKKNLVQNKEQNLKNSQDFQGKNN